MPISFAPRLRVNQRNSRIKNSPPTGSPKFATPVQTQPFCILNSTFRQKLLLVENRR